jgi:hypothetical protein
MPGFLYALFSLSLSSNRVMPEKAVTHLLLLNIIQLFSFGVTIAKYAADQMVLARLAPNETAQTRNFFISRVLPISFIYSSILFFTNGWATATMLMICLPIEVLVIITVVELNISKRFLKALLVSMAGYPLIFISYLMLSAFYALTKEHLLLLFVVVTAIKAMVVLLVKKRKQNQKNIMLVSPQVPVQQGANYLLFRSDQVLIATNVIAAPTVSIVVPNDYLFYAKMVDLYSGVATSMGPLLSQNHHPVTGAISYKTMLQKTPYKKIIFLAVVVQVILITVFLKKMDTLHLLLLIPTALSTLLIVPVNMINYEYFRNGNLKLVNKINLYCLLLGSFFFIANIFIKSTLVFACMVPVQLFAFVLFHNLLNKKNHV